MGIPFLGVDCRGRLQQKGASIRYGDSFFWGMDFRGRLQRKGASIWKAGGIRRKVLPYGTLRKEEGRNRMEVGMFPCVAEKFLLREEYPFL